MNRNVESHFSELPKIDIERSIFDRSSSHKTSFNVGDLIPFYIDEVLPGDTFNVTTSVVCRLQTPLTPIMDNMYLDTYYFFVPNRIVWEHWKEFMGENRDSAWIPQVEYSVPRINPPEGGWIKGTIADYFGIPVGVYNTGGIGDLKCPNALPFRGYALICDQWFRDQNLSDPLNIPFGDSDVTGVNTGNYVSDTAKGGLPFKVAKYHDYFTSCLPAPQKGPDVGLFPANAESAVGNMGQFDLHYVPVITRQQNVFDSLAADNYQPLKLRTPGSGGNTLYMRENTNDGSIGNRPLYWTDKTETDGYFDVVPQNLWADLSSSNITINELRIAFQLQKFFEKNARAGTRYREILKEHFGITSSDARMMIPEYLGGHRVPLTIHQVANQSQGESDFLGDLGAMSNTSDIHEDFIRSFEEHGFVIGVCCVRYDHSYPQGLERFWLRERRSDYYFPVFANLGEQAVSKDEIFWRTFIKATGRQLTFGYQEAWADYRYKPSRVSSEMRPNVTNSLATWHLADNYDTAPNLSDAWIREDKSNVDRVLSVTSSVADQIFCDFYVKNIATRPMPMYSIPGLIDHH